MSLHQSAVYAGSIAGGAVSGFVGQYYGWRSSFVLFGGVGVLLGVLLWMLLKEPTRGMSEPAPFASQSNAFPAGPSAVSHPDTHAGGNILAGFAEVFRNPMVLLLAAVFIGANFVAVVFLTWMPTFLYQKFHMSLAMAGLNGTAYLQIASVLGVLSGGLLADSLVKKLYGGRLLTQSLGLLCGVPFLFLTGWTTSVPWLILAMVGFGYFKGLYDANIFAGLYDVVPVARRGAAAGILNSLGWLGGGFAPIAIAVAAQRYGMSASISATAGIYLFIGLLLLWGARRLTRTRA
jgi:sugar phosphate permease